MSSWTRDSWVLTKRRPGTWTPLSREGGPENRGAWGPDFCVLREEESGGLDLWILKKEAVGPWTPGF